MALKLINKIQHRLNVVRAAATKRVILDFAENFGLVYFGRVSQHSDDQELVRGITVSADHQDRNYCVGSIQGYDVTLVQRTDKIHTPGKDSKFYTWLIMQFDLHVAEKLFPHVLVDSAQHGETFCATLRLKHNQLKQVSPALFAGHDDSFINSFSVYTSRQNLAYLPYVLMPDVTATLGHHFKQLDYEVSGDKLYVYANNTAVSRHLLDEMVRVGIWFSQRLDTVAAQVKNLET